MAWNVVIAGGGFGGRVRRARARAPAAEAVGAPDARQRRQLPALHAVPARGGGGDAGAAPRGHAAARHPQAHLPAARRGRPPTTRRRARSSCATHEGEVEELRYDQLLLALGSVSRLLPVPGLDRARDRLQEPRRRDLAAKPRRSRRSRPRTRARTRRAARSCSPTSSSAAATPASRRSPSCRTSPPTRWTRYPRARLHGMRWILVEATDRVLPEIDRRPRRVRGARAARARDRHPPRHAARGGRAADARAALDRRADPDPDGRLDHRRRAAPEPRAR